MNQFHDGMTLAEARDRLRTLADKGEHCPCCTQLVKVYKRPMSHVTARLLICLHKRHGLDFGHVPTLMKTALPGVAHQGGYATLASYWGLIEELQVAREDGGRAGWWRLTRPGMNFVLARSTVPKYARIYDGRCLGLTGEPISIRDALGMKFSYEELMAG